VRPRAALLLVALALVSLLLATRREAASSRPTTETPARAAMAEPHDAAEPAVDPGAIRDLFRFAEPGRAEARPPAEPTVAPTAAAPRPDAPRLVGLVRREGRLLAAMAIDGDVALLGPGDAVGGLTVLEVTEERVRVRRRDGAEESLAVP